MTTATQPETPFPDYHAAYLRLAQQNRRFTAFNPLKSGLGKDDGRMGGMADANFDAGGPSRRELEIAAWLSRTDLPPELAEAQFDIATLLYALEDQRASAKRATGYMLEAEQRAHEAENTGALGELASRYAMLRFAASNLERENTVLRAARDLCTREHCGQAAAATDAETSTSTRGD
jgi:hypothetical protein